MTANVDIVLKDVSELIDSLEESACLLENQTASLKERISDKD